MKVRKRIVVVRLVLEETVDHHADFRRLKSIEREIKDEFTPIHGGRSGIRAVKVRVEAVA